MKYGAVFIAAVSYFFIVRVIIYMQRAYNLGAADIHGPA